MGQFIEFATKETLEANKLFIKDLEKMVDKVGQFNELAKKAKLPSDTKTLIKDINVEIEKSNNLIVKSSKATEKQRLSELKLQTAREKAFDKFDRNLKKEEAARARKEKADIREQANQKKLLSAYNKLSVSLKEAEFNYRNLAVSYGKGSKQAIAARKEANKLRNTIDSINKPIGRFNDNVGNYASSLKGLLSAFGVIGGVTLFASAIKDAGKTIVEFDKQLIAVGKTTNLSGDQLTELGKKVIDLGLDLKGVSIKGLLQTSEIAGQLGIEGSKNILKFSKTIELLRLTSNVAGEEGARNFAKFIEISSDSVDNADRLGSVITELGNNFATTESEILSNSSEIQRGISIYNTSAESVLALGAATSALGISAEASRSALQKGFFVIDRAISSGEGLEKILKLTGLTQKELSEQFRTDATGVFNLFIKGLNNAQKSGSNLLNLLGDLNIKEKRSIAAIGAMSKNYGTLEESIKLASEQYISNNALIEEANASSKSLSSRISDMKDAWNGFILSLEDGNGVISNAFKSAISFTEGLAKGLRVLAQNEKQRQETFANKEGLNRFKSIQEQIRAESIKTGETIGDIADKETFRIEEEIATIEKRLEAKKKEKTEIDKDLEGKTSFDDLTTNSVVKNKEKQKQLAESIERTSNLLIIYNKELEGANELQNDLSEEIDLTNKNLNNENGNIDDNNKKRLKATGALQTTIEFYKKLIDQQRRVAFAESTSFEDTEKAVKNIDELNKTIEKLSKGSDIDTGFKIEFDIPNTEDIVNSLKKTKAEVSPLSEEMIRLREETEYFIDTITSDFLSDSSFSSLAQFLDGTFDSLLEGANTFEEKFAVVFNAVADVAKNALDIINTSQQIRFEEEINRLDQEKEIALSFAGESKESREAIEESFAEKKKEIHRKQAKSEKESAIFSSIINTAAAVVAALAKGGIPLAIAVGILGAAETALIATTPIPQFEKGTDFAQGGLSMVNDQKGSMYKEAIITPKGDVLRPEKRNALIDLPRGSKVLTAKQTLSFDKQLNSMVENNGILPVSNNIPNKIIVENNNGINKNELFDVMSKTVSKIQSNNVTIDKNGIHAFAASAYSKREMLNNRVSFNGKKF